MIVIGGHKLSRGLTLEGLSISYFARNSKAYDTLMQMCRWFGYRPMYDDLCRVYLPQDSINWYTFISTTIRELYRELDLMSKREQRPSEFGLKVREHPGAMIITARNKMGAAESEVRSQDLWGQVQRRFRFRKSIESNQRNLEYTKRFVRRLNDERIGSEHLVIDETSGSQILTEVEYTDIIEYIENIDLPEDDLGNRALVNHLNKMKHAKLDKPKVVLFNQSGWGKLKNNIEDNLSDLAREFINNEYLFSDRIALKLPKRLMEDRPDEYTVKSVHLGNSDDEKLFLPDDERKSVSDSVDRKAVSFDYLCSERRDYPGLIIYLFAVAVQPANELPKLGHGLMPTVGYTVSFPRPENLRGKTDKEIKVLLKETKHSYSLNKIHTQLKMAFNYEEYGDDE